MTDKGRHAYVVWILLFFMLVFLPGRYTAQETGMSMYVLDVGQGLCVVAETEGHWIMYDGGGRSTSSFVVSWLKEKGVDSLDLIVVSHYDEDHIGGVIGALYAVGTDQILSPDYEEDTAIYISYKEAVYNTGTDEYHPSVGDVFHFGDAVVQVIGPNGYQEENENDRSVAVRIGYGDVHFIICGDAQGEEEYEIASSGADISSDVYIVDHHGSASSSTDLFLNQVSPEIAVISCGNGNDYGHPTEHALSRIMDHGCSLYRTDKQGTITFHTDGISVWTEQDPCDDWTPGSVPSASVEQQGGSSYSPEGYYILNVSTKKFHLPSCTGVSQMSEKNKSLSESSREELISSGYDPCGNCHP